MGKPIGHIAIYFRLAFIFSILAGSWNSSFAQLNLTYDLKKPKAFENRKLKSELTPEKKINPVKRVKENLVSHYNFYYNAYNKLQDVLTTSKKAFKDSFDHELSFYNYTLEQTTSQKKELDSVIHKSNNGILLHDLRNDWVDDLYLLMGQAYFYQQKFDSAYDVFQYINYTFQPRNKDEIGLEKTIGSNLNLTGNIYTVSTKESGLSSHPAARNDALVWIIRTLIFQGYLDEAKSLIETLTRDQNFPKRLRSELSEQKAHYFYKINQADSCAAYLEKAIDAASTPDEKARRYFLIAQLKTKAGEKERAYFYFEKAINSTTDPIMEAYARIYQVALSSNELDFEKRTEEQISQLIRMAKREKFITYQPIIYNAAAELEIGRNKNKPAIDYLLKSNSTNTNDPIGRSFNNLKIATLAFNEKDYKLAKTYYDSIGIIPIDKQKDVEIKKKVTDDIVKLLTAIEKEDSLLAIAKMPQKEREEYLKTLLKKLKKEQGLIEEEDEFNSTAVITGNRGQRNDLSDDKVGNIFNNNQQKGEWYFNNPSLIGQGKIAFKNKWGSRPNSDNWRRLTALNATKMVSQRGTEGPRRVAAKQETKPTLSIETLANNLPLTPAQQQVSLFKKTAAYFQLGLLFQETLGDWALAIEWYEKAFQQGVDTSILPKLLYNLSFCHAQSKMTEKANYYKGILVQNFPTNELTTKLTDPSLALKQQKAREEQITTTYNRIYDLLLSGQYESALSSKKEADQQFGPNHWSAQLLYIESIYYIKTRNDKDAISTLNKISELYPQSPLSIKAKGIASVVERRSEIENELNAMQVTRQKEDSLIWIDDSPKPKPQETLTKKEITKPIQTQPTVAKTKVDSTQFKTPIIVQQASRFQFNANDPYAIMILMKDVDIVYINEAKRALATYHAVSFASKNLNIQSNKIGTTPYILISVFPNAAEALGYVDKTLPIGSKEIFPWLQPDKYKFIIISPENLKKISEDNATEEYIRFLQQQLPGKF